jgi:transposase
MVYTSSRTNSSRKGRANYSREFKQRLVEGANQPGISVSKLAQEHGVNANLLFKWRRDAKAEAPAPALYPIELVLPPSSTELLLPPPPQPETLTPDTASEPTPSGTIEIRLGRAMVVINGPVDTNALRMILETLRV